jgi:hypothetical protein
MKRLLVLAAIGAVLAAPAFAQQDTDRRSRTYGPSTVPPGGIYYYKHHGNRHHQLGASESKRTPKKRVRHRGSVSQK